jgi:membrane associated rhomboid family serine protease
MTRARTVIAYASVFFAGCAAIGLATAAIFDPPGGPVVAGLLGALWGFVVASHAIDRFMP